MTANFILPDSLKDLSEQFQEKTFTFEQVSQMVEYNQLFLKAGNRVFSNDRFKKCIIQSVTKFLYIGQRRVFVFWGVDTKRHVLFKRLFSAKYTSKKPQEIAFKKKTSREMYDFLESIFVFNVDIDM